MDDVCAWFQVTRDWIYDEVEAGRLPFPAPRPQGLRFDRSELVGYLKAATAQRSNRQQPTAQPDCTAGPGAARRIGSAHCAWAQGVFLGTPEQVAEALKTDVVDQGSDGLTINRVRDAHKPGAVAAMGKALLPVVS